MIARRTALASGVLATAAGIALAAACIEVVPLTVVRDSGLLADAGCSTCLHEPDKCTTEISTCQLDPACDTILRCVEELACFDRPVVDDKVTCGLPCAVEAGVTSVTDPRIERLLDVLRCGQTKCPGPCNLGDGASRYGQL
jgi:hypothetical protein